MIIKTKGNQLFLYGTIWDGDGAYFLDVFSRMDGVYPDIEVHIHCNGGSVFDGNLMYNTILNAKSACDGFVDGIAASMAGVLLMAFRKVFMAENAFIMLHAPSGCTWGDAQKHENNAGLLRSIEKNFAKKLVARTGKKEADVKKWMVGDNWFDAEQAKEAGLIDEIVDPVTQATVEDPAANFDNTFNSFAALMVAENTDKTLLNNSINMKQDLIDKFGLTGVTAQSSDTAILNAIEAHINGKTAQLQATATTAETKYKDLETAMNASRDAQIKAVLDIAQGEGKFAATQRETYESIGKSSGIEALNTVLDGLGKRQPISSQLHKNTGGGSGVTAREGWNWDKYQREAPRELEAMAQNDPDTYAALYEAKFNKPFKTN